jgi:hypothetical protein
MLLGSLIMLSRSLLCIFHFLLKGFTMNKFYVMMIAACVLAVSTANTADASVLITKRVEGIKKIADRVSKTVWNNKGAIAVGTVATVAVTNPQAATAAVSGTTDIVSNVVTGTADVAYAAMTGGTEAVTQRANARPTSSGSIIPMLLLFLAFIGICIIFVLYLQRRVRIWRVAVPLLVVGVLLCFGVTAEAATPAALAPAVKPLAHIAMWVVTAILIFL